MKLIPRMRAVLAACQLEADIEFKELGRRAGCKAHTARYTLNKILADGVAEKCWLIDFYRVGWQRFSFFFSTNITKATVRDKLIKYLVNSKRTAYLGEISGDFDYVVGVFGRRLGDIMDFQEELTGLFGDIFFTKAVSSRYSLAYLPRQYLAPMKVKWPQFKFQAMENCLQPDALDEKILSALTEHPAASLAELARQQQIPLTTLHNRFSKLKAQGVISGRILAFDALQAGFQSYTLLISTRGVTTALRQQIFDFAWNHPNCVLLLECLGGWDFEIDVEAENPSELLRLKEALSERFANWLKEIKVLAAFRIHKNVSFPG